MFPVLIEILKLWAVVIAMLLAIFASIILQAYRRDPYGNPLMMLLGFGLIGMAAMLIAWSQQP